RGAGEPQRAARHALCPRAVPRPAAPPQLPQAPLRGDGPPVPRRRGAPLLERPPPPPPGRQESPEGFLPRPLRRSPGSTDRPPRKRRRLGGRPAQRPRPRRLGGGKALRPPRAVEPRSLSGPAGRRAARRR